MADQSTRQEGSVNGDSESADGGREEDRDEHLSDVDPGAGCAEIWAHLSEQRENED